VIYQGEGGEIRFDADFERETVWATQAQIVKLFDVNQSNVSRAIKSILSDGEVDAKSNMRETHNTNKYKPVTLYSLDVVLAVGFRLRVTGRVIKFRRWANEVLKQHIMEGYTVNRKRLAELHKMLEIVSRSEIAEVVGVAEITREYLGALVLLEEYDNGRLKEIKGEKPKWELTYEEAREFLDELPFTGEFGKERNGSFGGIVAGLYQTFGGEELYVSVEEKAANLLYQVVKDHPFFDGNKRSGAALFVYFLGRNGVNGLNASALAAMTLMVALSKPEEKEVMVQMVMNLISLSEGGEWNED